jgi:hypothetical protein
MPKKLKARSIRRQSLRIKRRKKAIKKPSLKRRRPRSAKPNNPKQNFCYRKKHKSKSHHNLAKYVKEVSKEPETCQIMTPHGNIIDLPNKYPGDDFVFAELYTNPADKYHAEMVDSNILKDVYNQYHRMCF